MYHKKDLKSDILDVTVDFIRGQGYQDISLRKVAKRLDVSPTAVYRHYNSLSDLFNQAILSLSKDMTNYLQQPIINQDSSPVNDLKLIGCRFIEYAELYPNEFEFLFISEYSKKGVSLSNHNDLALVNFMKKHVEEAVDYLGISTDIQIIFNQLWCFIFGYAILIVKGELDFKCQLVEMTLDQLLIKKKEE